MDGTSLTVCEVNRTEGWFTFMLIAYTQKHIIVPHKAVGDRCAFCLFTYLCFVVRLPPILRLIKSVLVGSSILRWIPEQFLLSLIPILYSRK